MKLSAKEIIHLAKFRYEHFGQQSVHEFAHELGIRDYRYCPGCDDQSPVVDGACLVCGQDLSGIPDGCPFCNRIDPYYDGIIVDGSRAYQDCYCSDCGREWREWWTFDRIEWSEDGSKRTL